MSTVPQKYRPEPKRYERKDWLYQMYWGALKSQAEIADQTPVSRKKIRMEMAKHGIPTRETGSGYAKANPFAGFYGPREVAPAPKNTQYEHRETPVTQTGTQLKYWLPAWMVENNHRAIYLARKSKLYEQYWGQMMSQAEIADRVGATRETVRNRLRKHGIPRKASGHDPFGGFS